MNWVWSMLVAALVLSTITTPILIPDSYEQSIIADCWQSGTSVQIDCTNITTFFRPPLTSALIVPLLTFVDGLTALSIIAFMSAVIVMGLVTHHVDTLFRHSVDWSLGLWVALILIIAGFGTRLPVLLDSKWIALPWIMAGGGILMRQQISSIHSALLAACFGAAFLCRLENVLILLVSIPCIVLKAERRVISTSVYILITTAVIGGWMTLLWKEHGVVTVSPRFWESSLILLLDEMPLRWLQDLYGMGIWEPPFRTIAMEHSLQVDSDTSLLESFSVVEWFQWFNQHILGIFHPLHLLGLVCTLPIVRHKQWLHIFISLSVISAPSIAVTLIPQGRESVFPIIYILPLWLSVWIWTGLIAGYFIDAFVVRIAAPTILGILMFLSWISPNITIPEMIEQSTPGLATQYWLTNKTADNAIVLSTYETAPIVWLANREWQEWPSPWSMQHRIERLQDTKRPVFALVCNSDAHAWYSLSFTDRFHPPIAYIQHNSESFVVFDLSAALSETRP